MIKVTYRYNNIENITLLSMEFSKEFDSEDTLESWIKETEHEMGVEVVIISKEVV